MTITEDSSVKKTKLPCFGITKFNTSLKVQSTDEAKVELFGHYEKKYNCSKTDKTLHKISRFPDVMYKSELIMLWSCAVASGKTKICYW